MLHNSGVREADLDFVIPLPIGADKHEVLLGMRSSRHERCVLGGDEIGDFKAAARAGYTPVIGSYGFDKRKRLIARGEVPESSLFDDPAAAVLGLAGALELELAPPARAPSPRRGRTADLPAGPG